MPLHSSLESLMTAAGMEPSSIVARYLDAIGLRTAQTLAVFFTSAQHIKEWMQRFQTLVTTGTHSFKIEEETTLNVQTACLISIWQNCPSPPSAAATPAPTPTAPAPASSSTTDDKPPKSLPPGVWQQLLADYNQQKMERTASSRNARSSELTKSSPDSGMRNQSIQY